MTIILIGMPGVGKTCMGKALSSKLKLKHYDTDKVIEKKMKKPLHVLIAECGLEGFKKLEEKILLNINFENAIISTGGSAVYYDKAMEHFKSIGKVIYLYAKLDTIINRLGDFTERGIAMKEGQTIEDLYNERCSLYEKYADLTVDCSNNNYTAHRDEIISLINKKGE